MVFAGQDTTHDELRVYAVNNENWMRKPVALFVGLRYLRARKGSGFVSFVTFASVIGVALGVATLIVVLSVMNGFEKELRERLLGLTAHASIIQDGGLDDWPPLVEQFLRETDASLAKAYVAEMLTSDTPAAIRKVYGRDLDAMDREYVTWIRSTYLLPGF